MRISFQTGPWVNRFTHYTPTPWGPRVDPATSAFYPSGKLATFSLHIPDNMAREDINKIFPVVYNAPTEASSKNYD